MDLRLGCREKSVYHLRDGQALDRQQWISLVEEQIKKHGHEGIVADIEKTVKLWNKNDTAHEVALQVYVSKYCSNVEVNVHKSMGLKIVKDNMGYDQLSF